jgi:hypothetical protein
MGIDPDKFSVYSIEYSAIPYSVKQKVYVKDLEKSMHYKQKSNTTVNHYAVKETSKSVGLLLAKAAAEGYNETIKKSDIMRNSVKNLRIKIEYSKKLDADVNKVIPIIHIEGSISKTLKDSEEKLPEEEKLNLKEKQWELVNLAKEVKGQKAQASTSIFLYLQIRKGNSNHLNYRNLLL